MAAIFTYGFKTAADNFKKAKCKLVTLSDYDTLLRQALQSGYVTDKDLKSLAQWREDPAEWGK
jgi:orotate phosphoribosyltransferase